MSINFPPRHRAFLPDHRSGSNGNRLPRRSCSDPPAFNLTSWCNERAIHSSKLVNPILGLCLSNPGSVRAVPAFCVLRFAQSSNPHFFYYGPFNIVLRAHMFIFCLSLPSMMPLSDENRYARPSRAIFLVFVPDSLSE